MEGPAHCRKPCYFPSGSPGHLSHKQIHCTSRALLAKLSLRLRVFASASPLLAARTRLHIFSQMRYSALPVPPPFFAILALLWRNLATVRVSTPCRPPSYGCNCSVSLQLFRALPHLVRWCIIVGNTGQCLKRKLRHE